jgi:hypothetical protein
MLQMAAVFREPAKHKNGSMIPTKSAASVVIPASIDKFHSALDGIEIDIVSRLSYTVHEGQKHRTDTASQRKAKAMYLHDLKANRTRRAQKEKAAADAIEAEKSRLAAESAAKSVEANKPIPLPPKPVPAVQEDIEMGGQDVEIPKTETPGQMTGTGNTPAQVSTPAKDTSPKRPREDDNSGNGDRAKKSPRLDIKISTDDPLPTSTNMDEDPTPATAGYDTINFDSMFDSTGGGGDGGDALNFADFGAFDGTDLGNLDAGLPSVGQEASGGLGGGDDTQDDFLAGLESYAAGASDPAPAMPDMTSTNLTTNKSGFPAQNTDTSADQSLDLGTLHTTGADDGTDIFADMATANPEEATDFDDFFKDMDFSGGGDNTGGDSEFNSIFD